MFCQHKEPFRVYYWKHLHQPHLNLVRMVIAGLRALSITRACWLALALHDQATQCHHYIQLFDFYEGLSWKINFKWRNASLHALKSIKYLEVMSEKQLCNKGWNSIAEPALSLLEIRGSISRPLCF